MSVFTRRIVPLVGAFALVGGAQVAMADNDDKGLPADQVISAIETAGTAHKGNIQDVEIEEKDNRLVVEVTVVDADGKETEVRVDPQTNEIIK